MKFEEGKYYDLYNRSVNNELLFKEEMNYYFFLKKYAAYTEDVVNTFAYCLMPTHFHLFVQIRQNDNSTAVEQAFKNLFISYSKAINQAFNRHGSLFQNKYKKKEVADSSYFSQIIAYIHFNPVRAGLCSSPETWSFSSYKSILSSQHTLLKRDEVLEWFGGRSQFVSFHQYFQPTEKIKKYLLN